jgi:hypothetical protein
VGGLTFKRKRRTLLAQKMFLEESYENVADAISLATTSLEERDEEVRQHSRHNHTGCNPEIPKRASRVQELYVHFKEVKPQ